MLGSTQALPTLPQTPKSSAYTAVQHRLLYRGALSLPDSYLLLDGISFVAETRPNLQGSPAADLFTNSLALVLESMRGRPSLHLLGTERLQDVWLDSKTNVSVYIHPNSILSRLYFQNILCLDAIISEEKRTHVGVRVSLTENSDPDTPDFLIYGQLVPSQDSSEQSLPCSSTSVPATLQMYAARILTAPPPPVMRLPRPDDPTPRKPSAYALGESAKRKREMSGASLVPGGGIKKAKPGRIETSLEEDEQVRRAREVMLRGPSKISREKSEADIFKVPPLPTRSASLATMETVSHSSMDVFGSVGVVKNKGKGKEGYGDRGSTELEKANKTVIKQATVTWLRNRGLKKGDTEFDDWYQAMYRGVTFALRITSRTQAVNIRVVERLLEAHAKLYTNGNGEPHISGSQDARR
ncbi:hypothetical protein BC835DRAFT_1419128 [Cytidiella melzeri]|nr:hypothetical protein BC835DRAFT_1419128 [Cytidiella melzeri]